MSWVDKAHKKAKIHNMVDQAMKDPRYQIAERKKIQDATWEAFDRFLLISADYLYRLGFRRKRLMKFLEFAVYQMKCIESDPEYFKLLNDALSEETGLDILKILGRERKGRMKLIDIDDFLKFVKSLEEAGAEYISFDDLQKFANEQSDEFEREIAERLKNEKDFCAEKISCGGCYSYYDGRIDGVNRVAKIIGFCGGREDAMGCGIS